MIPPEVPELTDEQRHVLEREGVIEGPSFVLMSIEAYRDFLGVDTNEDLAAIGRGIQQMEAGSGRSVDKADAAMRQELGCPPRS